MRIKASTKTGAAVAVCWLGIVALGFSFAYGYEATPGKGAETPQGQTGDWPKESRLVASADRATIVHFVLPECPCSTVGLHQLGEAIGRKPEGSKLIVVVCGTMGKGSDPEQAPNVQGARAIPGAEVVFDSSGVESRRFDAHTSGQTIVFSPEGKRIFSGGVTVARGHYGGNAGLEAVKDILQNRKPSTSRSLVYGCNFSPNP